MLRGSGCASPLWHCRSQRMAGSFPALSVFMVVTQTQFTPLLPLALLQLWTNASLSQAPFPSFWPCKTDSHYKIMSFLLPTCKITFGQ